MDSNGNTDWFGIIVGILYAFAGGFIIAYFYHFATLTR